MATQRFLQPLARCKCGRPATFDLVTSFKSGGFNRFATTRERRTKKCVVCAEKLAPDIGSRQFPTDDDVVVLED